jgi:hypothetical protein
MRVLDAEMLSADGLGGTCFVGVGVGVGVGPVVTGAAGVDDATATGGLDGPALDDGAAVAAPGFVAGAGVRPAVGMAVGGATTTPPLVPPETPPDSAVALAFASPLPL